MYNRTYYANCLIRSFHFKTWPEIRYNNEHLFAIKNCGGIAVDASLQLIDFWHKRNLNADHLLAVKLPIPHSSKIAQNQHDTILHISGRKFWTKTEN
jgi:hypothetical protein